MAANEYAHLKTGTNEYIKQYLVYDGSDRLEYVYEARANALDGEPCLVTRYTYWTTSTRVKQMEEYEGSWSSAYDI